MRFLILSLLFLSTYVYSAESKDEKREYNKTTGCPYYYEDEPKPVGIAYHIRKRGEKSESIEVQTYG